MKVEEIITNRILKLLEAGTVPWHKPWANRQTGDRCLSAQRHYQAPLSRNQRLYSREPGLRLAVLAHLQRGASAWRSREGWRARLADRLLEMAQPRD